MSASTFLNDSPGQASPSLPDVETEALVQIDGVWIDVVSEVESIHRILKALHQGHGGHVVTPNLDFLRRCRLDAAFQELVNNADLAVADGMPLIWASRLQGTPLPERVAGSSLINTLSQAAAAEGFSIFLLGGDPGTAEAAAQVLQKRYPALKVAGTSCPMIGAALSDQMRGDLIKDLESAHPDIVFVGLNSPKQEYLISALKSAFPKSWWLGVGISFSFLCGRVPRAPRWMQITGLEWAYRLWREPKRLVRRYLVSGIPYAVGMLFRAGWIRVSHRSALAKRWR